MIIGKSDLKTQEESEEEKTNKKFVEGILKRMNQEKYI